MSFFRRELAFYTLGIGPLDADWLLQTAFWTLIGWSLQGVTSLRHAVAAKVLLLGSAFFAACYMRPRLEFFFSMLTCP